LQNTSLETTSSFFWSSPWMLAAPAKPVRLEMPERLTSEAICLQAVATEERTTASSGSSEPLACSCRCFSVVVFSREKRSREVE